MKNWKAVIAGMLLICLSALMPFTVVFSEEEIQEEETEEPIPESYYYSIESNETAGWPQGPMIESASAVVMDLDTNVLLYSKQATEKRYPASITKIMTTLLLVENCDLDDTITFSEIVYDLEEGSSHLGVMPGEEMTLRQCAYGIMLASANDISNGQSHFSGVPCSNGSGKVTGRHSNIHRLISYRILTVKLSKKSKDRSDANCDPSPVGTKTVGIFYPANSGGKVTYHSGKIKIRIVPALAQNHLVGKRNRAYRISANAKIYIPGIQSSIKKQVQNFRNTLPEALILQRCDLFLGKMRHLKGNEKASIRTSSLP